MRNNLLLVFVLIFSYSKFKSQSFSWAKQIGGLNSESATSVKIDASGNVYTLGNFNGVTDFDPGPASYTLSYYGSTDIFLTKFDSLGNFIWAKVIGGINDEAGNDLFLDGGNIFITGTYQTGIDFDPGSGTYTLSSGSGQNAFVLNLDNSGNFMWVSSLGSSSVTVGKALSVDIAGNIYVTGTFTGINSDFDPGVSTFTMSSSGVQDVFISKLNSSGGFIWAKKIGGTSVDSPNSIFVDASSNVHVIGNFQSSFIDLDPGIGTFTASASSGFDEIFIIKLNTTGVFQWGKQIGGNSYDLGLSISVDASGNVYALGNFYDTADMDPGPGTFTLTPGAPGFADIFISKFDVNGNFSWAKQFGGVSGEMGFALTLDFFGNIYFTGNFNGSPDFDPGLGVFNLTSTGSPGNYDIFTAKVDNSGNFVWAKSMGGASIETGFAIAVSPTGYNVLTAGNFYSSNTDFDPGIPTYTLSAIGNSDAFICRLTGVSTSVYQYSISGTGNLVYPNPTTGIINFRSDFPDNIKNISVTNPLGQIIASKEFSDSSIEKKEMDLSSLPKGLYLINQNGIISGNSIKLIIN